MNNNDLMYLLKTRRTYRKFDESRKIPNSVIEKMTSAVRYSSSAMNRQPLKYIYVQTEEYVNKIFENTRWAGILPSDIGIPKIGERPVMFVIVLADNELKSTYTEFDAGLAVSNMTLSAWSCGVGSCILGSVNRDGVREILDISTEYDILYAVAFGYPIHESFIEDFNGNINYYVDDLKNYHVPKRNISDTVEII